jgi:hypothetical protein
MSSGHPRRRLGNVLDVIAAVLFIASLVRLRHPEARSLLWAGVAFLTFAVMLHIIARRQKVLLTHTAASTAIA